MSARTATSIVLAVALTACGTFDDDATETDRTRRPAASTATIEEMATDTVESASVTPLDTAPSVPATTSPTDAATTTQPAPTTTPPSTTTTTAPTTTPPSTTAPAGPEPIPWLPADAAPLVADATCSSTRWSPMVRSAGELTVSRDGNVIEIDPATGIIGCFPAIDRVPTALDWNPGGDLLLVDADAVISDEGWVPSGFTPGTAEVVWSHPTGSAVIAPSIDRLELTHIDIDGLERTDVSSVEVTWAAAYHPSGLAIFSAGVDRFGRSGIFVSGNSGPTLRDDAKQLVALDDPATSISEIEVAPDGSWIAFVHDHTGGTLEPGVLAHVHRLGVPDLTLTDLAVYPDAIPTNLTVSEQGDGSLAWVTRHPAGTVGLDIVRRDGERTTLDAPGAYRIEPVGFVDEGSLAVLIGSDDPADRDLWLLAPDGTATLVVTGVSAAATRTARFGSWNEPPLEIEQQAVG